MRPWFLLLVLWVLAGCAASGGGGVYHTVGKGQTLYSIGKSYRIDPERLAQINGIKDPSRLRPGDRLYIPDAPVLLEVVPTALTQARSETAPPAGVASKAFMVPPAERTNGGEQSKSASKSLPSAPASTSISSTQNRTSTARFSQVPKGRFLWPLRGKLLKGFGPQGKNINKGLEIQGGQGVPVLSSAAGKVIYSGDGITGFGNLIIIKHDGSLFTVYGYNAKNLVETGAFVSQGQAIAHCGRPPRGGSPRLYFEIRNGKDPVNPIFYLP